MFQYKNPDAHSSISQHVLIGRQIQQDTREIQGFPDLTMRQAGTVIEMLLAGKTVTFANGVSIQPVMKAVYSYKGQLEPRFAASAASKPVQRQQRFGPQAGSYSAHIRSVNAWQTRKANAVSMDPLITSTYKALQAAMALKKQLEALPLSVRASVEALIS